MERTNTQTTQQYITALKFSNKEMLENQVQIQPVIEGLLAQMNTLKEENDVLRKQLEVLVASSEEKLKQQDNNDQLDELGRQINLLKKDCEEKDAMIRQLHHKNALDEESFNTQKEDLIAQIEHYKNTVVNLQSEVDRHTQLFANETTQIQLLSKQLEDMKKEKKMVEMVNGYNTSLQDLTLQITNLRAELSAKPKMVMSTFTKEKCTKEMSGIVEESEIEKGIDLRLSPIRVRPKSPKSVVLLSGLSPETKGKIQSEVQMRNKILAPKYSSAVTHVVVSSKLTMAAVQALVEGKWVVSKNWVLEGMRSDEERHGVKREHLFDGKKFFVSREYLEDAAGRDVWEILKESARIYIVEKYEEADFCLIGKREILKGRNVYTREQFLKALPFPKCVFQTLGTCDKDSLMSD